MCQKKRFSCLSSANSPSIFTTLCSHTQIQILMWSLYSAFSFHFSEVFWILLKTSKETVEWQPKLLNIRLCGILVTPKIRGRILKTNDIFLKNASALLFFLEKAFNVKPSTRQKLKVFMSNMFVVSIKRMLNMRNASF